LAVTRGRTEMAGVREPEFRIPSKKGSDDPRAEVRHLSREQRVPHAMFFDAEMLPVLRNEVLTPYFLPCLCRGGGPSGSGGRGDQLFKLSKHSCVLCGQ